MGSTRLPGKVLQDIVGQPMLKRVVDRVKLAKTIDDIVIATTTHPKDDAIVSLCTKYGWSYFRGSENDVLDRYYQAAIVHQADVVVRITSDCPLHDAEIIDKTVQKFIDLQPNIDYVANTLTPRTYPRGLDTEVIHFDALKRAWCEDKNNAWREHVTPYIYQNSKQFTVFNITNEIDYSNMRWTVDTPKDLKFVRKIYNHFGYNDFSWCDILALLDKNPTWLIINQSVLQKVVV